MALGFAPTQHREAAERDFEIALKAAKRAEARLKLGDCRQAFYEMMMADGNVTAARVHAVSTGSETGRDLLEAVFIKTQKLVSKVKRAVEKRCLRRSPA